MKVFIQSIVAQLLLNPYIYWRGRQALPQQKKWQVSYLLLFVLELCLYFFGFFFREDLPDSVFIPIMNICNTWYIGSIYITLGLLCLEVIRISQRKWKWLPRMISKHWQECKRILFILFVIGTGCLLYKAHLNVIHPVVKHLYIDLPKGSSSRDSLKIVMETSLY